MRLSPGNSRHLTESDNQKPTQRQQNLSLLCERKRETGYDTLQTLKKSKISNCGFPQIHYVVSDIKHVKNISTMKRAVIVNLNQGIHTTISKCCVLPFMCSVLMTFIVLTEYQLNIQFK